MAWQPAAEPDALSVLAAADEAGRRAQPALVVDGRAVDWGELAERAREAIARLDAGERRGGGGATRPRALISDVGLESLVWIAALLHRRTPIVLLHPRHPDEDHRRFLAHCGWRRVGRDGCGRGAGEDEPWALEPMGPNNPLGDYGAEGDEAPAVVLRTSGSAGGPKGVVLSRRALLASAEASAFNLGWREGDRWLLALPVAHIGGFSILTRCLIARRAVVVEPMDRFDPERVAEVLEEQAVTLLSLVPTALGRLLDHCQGGPPPSLRAVLLGGAATSPALLRRASDTGWPVLTTYGCTEACSQIATRRPGSRGGAELGCGLPLPGFEVRILGGGDDGEPGPVAVRGPALMSGYLPPWEETFDAEGFFVTGDLGRFDAGGHLHILGRRDDVVISGGENVHPSEVEAILGECPLVAEACVVGVEDPAWGQIVAAVVVPHTGGGASTEALNRWARGRLAPHQRPRRIAWSGALPRNANGKVDRRRVREILLGE